MESAPCPICGASFPIIELPMHCDECLSMADEEDPFDMGFGDSPSARSNDSPDPSLLLPVDAQPLQIMFPEFPPRDLEAIFSFCRGDLQESVKHLSKLQDCLDLKLRGAAIEKMRLDLEDRAMKASRASSLRMSGNMIGTSTAPPSAVEIIARMRRKKKSLRSSWDDASNPADVVGVPSSTDDEDDEEEEELFFHGADVWTKHFAEDSESLVMDPTKNPNVVDDEISFLPPVEEFEGLSCLNEMQLKAMRYVVDTSRTQSAKQYPETVKKAVKLGFTEEDVQKTLRYIRDKAPIIVHFHPQKVLRLLMEDTHYRNQFETGTSSGCLSRDTRIGWENRLFNSIYERGCPDTDRVKYGVLNVVNDPVGIKCCSGYGDSYMVLKKVRLRTSFANKDTSAAGPLSCCEYYCHVLHDYNDRELRAVLSVGSGKMESHDSNVINTYKEIQIHGPVCLKEHVAAIVMNKKYHADAPMRALVEAFCAKNGCELVFME